MAQFDESKVINALHPEKAEIGKKYWVSDQLVDLRSHVTNDCTPLILTDIREDDTCYPFICNNRGCYQFLYPYEEPPKQRMTNFQLMEWLAKGNGMFKHATNGSLYYISKSCSVERLNEEVDEDIIIRTWDSEEWMEPTVDIYERDCKKED